MNIYDRIINILLETKIHNYILKLNEVADIKGERGEFLRVSGGDRHKARAEMSAAKRGREVQLSPQTFSNRVSNTDAPDVQGGSRFSNLRKWATSMKNNDRGKDRRRRVFNQVQSNTDDPSIVRSGSQGRELVAGNTRASLRAALGKPIKAHVYKSPS
jgi:hypothetical protein